MMNSTMQIRRSVVVAADREKVWRAITQMDNIAAYLQEVDDV
jgi:uncharacterized protein YndB with AHSA1/START domain